MITLFECRARRPMENITKLNTLLVIIDEEKERAGKERRQRQREKTFRELHHHMLFRQ